MNPDNQSPRPVRPVMDVQPPRPNPAPSQVVNPLDNPVAPADSIASVTPDPGQFVGQPPLQQTAPAPQPPKKHTGLIVAIVTIVVISLIGAGVGTFIWYKSTHKPAPAATTTQTQSDRVGVEEVDTTTAAIDKSLNSVNDSSDVTPNDLTDTTLGL